MLGAVFNCYFGVCSHMDPVAVLEKRFFFCTSDTSLRLLESVIYPIRFEKLNSKNKLKSWWFAIKVVPLDLKNNPLDNGSADAAEGKEAVMWRGAGYWNSLSSVGCHFADKGRCIREQRELRGRALVSSQRQHFGHAFQQLEWQIWAALLKIHSHTVVVVSFLTRYFMLRPATISPCV